MAINDVVPHLLLRLAERADVADHFFDLLLLQLAVIGWHLALAFRDDPTQLIIGLLLNVRRTEIANLEGFAHRRVASAVGAMTRSTFRLEDLLAGTFCCECTL